MRKTRVALLLLLVLAIAVVIGGYQRSQKRNRMLAPAKPPPLPSELHSVAKNWSWSRSSEDRSVVEVRAGDFRQIKDSSRLELEGVELKIFSKTGETYDFVRCRKAEFDQPAEKLYSDGEVTIVLGLPASGLPTPGRRSVEIRTSGLTYDNKTAVASTDRPAHFQFENGEGRSTGAVYDSARRYLWMKNDAEVIGLPSLSHAETDQPGAPARMRIRAGELHYYEAEQKVELRPWSSLERGNQGVRGADSIIFLEKGDLKRVEALKAQGWDISPGREVRFGGDFLEVNFAPQQMVTRATAIGAAQIASQSSTGATKATGGRVDLEFVAPADTTQSELSVAHVRDKARVESVPVVPTDRPRPETRILTAEWVKLTMMPGGEDLKSVETLAAGRLEFLPNQAEQWKRVLTAERISAGYLPGNRIETLRAVGNAHLRSEPPAAATAKSRKAPPAPRLTWSDNLEASFDPQTGQMRELRQRSNFRYLEGPRQARADNARFDLPNDRVYLETAARVWDENGLTTAAFFVLNQKEDRFRAEGGVTSTHQEKAKPAPGGVVSEALFAPDQPMHAVARQLDSERRNRLLHYRGGARLWQDRNSIQAEEIDLDREAKILSARGGVLTVLVEDKEDEKETRKPAPPKTAAPRLVTISADSLVYTDENRRAFFTGHVVMRRQRMTVKAAEMEAFLRPRNQVRPGESRLERAFAKGKVEILETAADRRSLRRGYADQAEYFAGEEKVVLRGGAPTVEQPDRGFTRGSELTYYINDDRLLVSGRPGVRSETLHKGKRN